MTARPIVRLSAGDRRALRLGAVALLLIVGLGRGLPAARRYLSERRGEARRQVEGAERHRARLADRAATLGRRAAATRRLREIDGTLFVAASPSAAAAAMATHLSALASDAGVDVSAVSVQAAGVATHGYVPVTASFAASGAAARVIDLLASIEGADKRLAIRSLDVSAPGAHAWGEVRAQVQVSGLAHLTTVDGEQTR